MHSNERSMFGSSSNTSTKPTTLYERISRRWNALAGESSTGLLTVASDNSSSSTSPLSYAVQRVATFVPCFGMQQSHSNSAGNLSQQIPEYANLPMSPVPSTLQSDCLSPRSSVLSCAHGRPLHHSELAALKQRFKELDASGRGVLSRAEFHQLFRSIVELPSGVDGSESSPLFDFAYNLFYSDGREQLDLKEFISGCWMLCGSEEERIRHLFHMYDKDNSGGLSVEELKTVFRVMRSFAIAKGGSETEACRSIGLPGHRRCESDSNMKELAERAMAEQDRDKDGEIGFEDFQQWCSNNPIVKVWMDMLSFDTARGIARIRDERERELLAKELNEIGLMTEKFWQESLSVSIATPDLRSSACSPGPCLYGGTETCSEFRLNAPQSSSVHSFTTSAQKSELESTNSGRSQQSSQQEADAIQTFEIDFNKLNFERRIGEGSFAEVFSGRWLDSSVAIKVFKSGLRVIMNSNGSSSVVPQSMGGETLDSISFDPNLKESLDNDEMRSNIEEYQERSQSQGRSRFLQEISLLVSLRHPHVLFYMGACVQPQYPLCIVSELIDGGSLYTMLHGRKNKKLTIAQKFKLTQDIARGMFYLHSRTPVVLHRDLKSANILVERQTNDELKAKIIDFGLSKLSSAEVSRSNAAGICGSLVTMAPEIMARETYKPGSDVYSFGILTWEIFTGRVPFRGIAPGQLIHMVSIQKKRPSYRKQDRVPQGIKAIVKKCWHHNVNERIDFMLIVRELNLLKHNLSI